LSRIDLVAGVFDQTDFDEFFETLRELGQDRPTGGCNDDVSGQLPTELLRHLEAMGLGAFGVVGPQIDVDKGPAVFVADLTAESIDVVVVSFDRDGLGSINGGADNLPLF